MAKGKITKRAVDALVPGERDAFLWDEVLPGFGLKVTPAGRKVYLVQYRMGGRGSPVRRVTIGAHGVWTPDEASKEARRLLALKDSGIDPAEDKRKAKREAGALSFEALADRFLKQHIKREAAASYDFVESALRLYITPKWRSKRVSAIERADAKALIAELPTASVRRNVYSVLRWFIAWALDSDLLATDPLQGMKAPKPVASRDHVLEDREIVLVWRASQSIPYPFGPWFRLLLLTGQRRDEVAGLNWQELDRTRGEWVLPASRAKNAREHLVLLSAPVIAELDALAGGDKWPSRGLVFTTTGKTPISGYSRAKRRLDGLTSELAREADGGEEIDPWRVHDLRRTMATIMQRLGIASEVIEACENRVKKGVSGTYQRYTYAPEKRVAFDKWGGFVLRVVDPNSNIVPLVRIAGGD